MMPLTPQKKKSLQLGFDSEPHPQKFMNHQIIHPISRLPNEESNKKKQMQNNLKSCLGGSEGGVREINKMVLAKKYVQQQIQLKLKYREKQKEKDYREVVMSDQFVRSHKLYKMLKQQVLMGETRQSLQLKNLTQILGELQKQSKTIKDKNYVSKLEIWEKRNQLMELKTMLEEEEAENRRLVQEYQSAYYLHQQEQLQGQYQQDQEQEQKEGQEIMCGQQNQLEKAQKAQKAEKQETMIGFDKQRNQEVQETKIIVSPGNKAMHDANELINLSDGQIQNLKKQHQKHEEQSLSKSIILSQKQQWLSYADNKTMEGRLITKNQKCGEQLFPITHKDQMSREEKQEEKERSEFGNWLRNRQVLEGEDKEEEHMVVS